MSATGLSQQQITDSDEAPRRARWIIPALLLTGVLLVTVAVYAPTYRFDFVDDDTLQIVRNPLLRSWRSVPQYFGTAWSHGDLRPGMPSMPYYRPIFLVWLFVNYQLFGPSTTAYHITALLLHVIAVLLLYLVVQKLTANYYVAAITAFLFGVHPIHIEAVTWVSGATEALVAVFTLAAFLCYLQSKAGSAYDKTFEYCSIGLFAVALFSKETAIVFPAVLMAHSLLYDDARGPLRRRVITAAHTIAPYVVICGVYLVSRFLARVDVGAYRSYVSLSACVLTLPSVIWFYIRHVMWPFALSPVYDLPYVNGLSVPDLLTPVVAVALVGVGLFLWARRDALVAFASCWAVLFVLPPLYLRGLPQREIAHDRYLYLPSVGVCLLIGWLLYRLLNGSRARRIAGWMGIVLIGVSWTGSLWSQNRTWSDDVTLFGYAYRVAPGNPRALRQYSVYLARNDRCADAVPLLEKYLRLQPDPDHQYALGVCHFKSGQTTQAQTALRAAIALAPDYQEPYVLLAIMKLQERNFADAEQILREADRNRTHGIEPPGLHLVRGEILAAREEFQGAAEEFKRELMIEPPIFRGEAEADLTEVERREQTAGERPRTRRGGQSSEAK